MFFAVVTCEFNDDDDEGRRQPGPGEYDLKLLPGPLVPLQVGRKTAEDGQAFTEKHLQGRLIVACRRL